MNFLVDPVMQGSTGGETICSGLNSCGWFVGQCDDLDKCFIFWETSA